MSRVKVLTGSSLLIMRKPVAKVHWRLFSKRTAQRVLNEAPCAFIVCPSQETVTESSR